MNYSKMNQFDVAYSRCMESLNKWYKEGDFDKMSEDSRVWGKMLQFEKELNVLWGRDYVVFRGVLISYFRFMKGVLKNESE